MLTDVQKTQRMGSALTIFRTIPQRWWWIPQSHHTSNRWWMHTHSPNKLKKLNKRLLESCWKLFFGTERSADGWIHAKRDHNNAKIYYKTLKKLHRVDHLEQKAWNADTQCGAPPWQCLSTYTC
jgi:hypothetical protein